MAGFSRYLQRSVLDHVFKTQSYTAPTNIYVALFNTGPTECTGTDYAREVCNIWGAASDADPSVIQNTNAINFGTGAVNWGVITHFALYDDITGGNLLADITLLASPKTIGAGDPVSFAIGDLVVTLD
jgi:hypothetical protein